AYSVLSASSTLSTRTSFLEGTAALRVSYRARCMRRSARMTFLRITVVEYAPSEVDMPIPPAAPAKGLAKHQHGSASPVFCSRESAQPNRGAPPVYHPGFLRVRSNPPTFSRPGGSSAPPVYRPRAARPVQPKVRAVAQPIAAVLPLRQGRV